MMKNTPSPDKLTNPMLLPAFLSKEGSTTELLPERATPSVSFPISAIAHEQHPRTSVWAGLAEAGHILAEAETHKGAPLTKAELRTLMDTHLDAYDPNWAFGQRGIADEWMSGWQHAFMHADRQIARARFPDPLSGIGSMDRDHVAPSYRGDSVVGTERQRVRFRHVQIQVADPHEYWQGVWEGQCAALDEQDLHQTLEHAWGGPEPRSLTTIRVYDDLLDLVAEAGNYGLEFVVGYVLGYSEGLLCGRIWPPTRMEVPSPSAYPATAQQSA